MRLAALYNDYADEGIPDNDRDIPDVDMEEQAGDEPADVIISKLGGTNF